MVVSAGVRLAIWRSLLEVLDEPAMAARFDAAALADQS
jgi:hypothetical protein